MAEHNELGKIGEQLAIDYLLKNGFKIHSLVFNGEFEEEVKNAIANYASECDILHISSLATLTKIFVKATADKLKLQLSL